MAVTNSGMDITRMSVLKKVSPDRQHGSARWTRACQLAAQSPRGEIVTAQTARGQSIFFNPPRGRASDLYAPRHIRYAGVLVPALFWRHLYYVILVITAPMQCKNDPHGPKKKVYNRKTSLVILHTVR
jgi:hypothetical protein